MYLDMCIRFLSEEIILWFKKKYLNLLPLFESYPLLPNVWWRYIKLNVFIRKIMCFIWGQKNVKKLDIAAFNSEAYKPSP